MMLGVFPARSSTLRRLFLGALVVASLSLLYLVPLSWGIIGQLWPMFLLWAVCGWAGLGANISVIILVSALGFWLDGISGTAAGTWVFLALATYSLTILVNLYLGVESGTPAVRCGACGGLMLMVMAGLDLWLYQRVSVGNCLFSTMLSVGLYPLVARLFDVSEDEA